jgi:hypothetical protein
MASNLSGAYRFHGNVCSPTKLPCIYLNLIVSIRILNYFVKGLAEFQYFINSNVRSVKQCNIWCGRMIVTKVRAAFYCQTLKRKSSPSMSILPFSRDFRVSNPISFFPKLVLFMINFYETRLPWTAISFFSTIHQSTR